MAEKSRYIPLHLVATDLRLNGRPEYMQPHPQGLTIVEGLFTPGNVGARFVFETGDDTHGLSYFIDPSESQDDRQFAAGLGGWLGSVQVDEGDILEEQSIYGTARRLTVTAIEPYCTDQGERHSNTATAVVLRAGGTMRDVADPRVEIARADVHDAALKGGRILATLDGVLKPYCAVPLSAETRRHRTVVTGFAMSEGGLVFDNTARPAADRVHALREELVRRRSR